MREKVNFMNRYYFIFTIQTLSDVFMKTIYYSDTKILSDFRQIELSM